MNKLRTLGKNIQTCRIKNGISLYAMVKATNIRIETFANDER